MASLREFPNSGGNGKRGSQDSRGFAFPEGGSETGSDVTSASKTPRPPGTFHQYERIDLDPLSPVGSEGKGQRSPSDSNSGGERGASRSPLLGHSETETLLVPSGKPTIPKKPKTKNKPAAPAQGKMAAKPGKVAGDAKHQHLSPPSGADPTVGAKLASHSPEREPIYGYSLAQHDCQIRSPGPARPGWEHTQTTNPNPPATPCKAPVPVPRSKRDSSRPSSSASLSASSTSHPSATTPSDLAERVNPETNPEVIVKQPGRTDPSQSSRKLQAPGDTAASHSKTEPSTSKKNKKEKEKKGKEADAKPHVDSIPQTNFMIGLLVTFCFNPPLGLIAMIISLRAAAAYRDGDKKKGAFRARVSIIISLISIMLTMVVVSTLLVYTAVNKHGYGKKGSGKKSFAALGF
ncbi:hypothetical protein EGW08_008251 [Elysia chlorotica]|uniref:Uncharacterized protein n=1 Tax=Elysia chlorotica TaxID=188477 RepID=A0A3S1BHT7_ELYCH|nr:hypothetical protein EGW08_008251 [Elysia chlorotica]